MIQTPKRDAPLTREQFAARRDAYRRRTIDELIDLLASPDLTTRFLAEMVLRDKTST